MAIAIFSGAAAWAFTGQVWAQPAPAVIGLLNATKLDEREVAAFRDGLLQAGYMEGRNLLIKYRAAEGRYDRLPELAAGLVNRQVAVIVGRVICLRRDELPEDFTAVVRRGLNAPL